MQSKETKPKEKETTFIQRKFRKMKDNHEKRKSQLLEQEVPAETESSQTKTTEKANNIDQEHKDFDVPLHKTKPDTPLEPDPALNSGKEPDISKSNDDKKSDEHSSQTIPSSVQETESNASIEAHDFQLEMESKAKRSQSLSSKVMPNRVPSPMRRKNSHTIQNNYSK